MTRKVESSRDVDVRIPAVVTDLITAPVAREIAEPYQDEVVFPDEIVVDDPEDDDRMFPDWPAPVLVLAYENQGVVTWGVPLREPDPPVLVGGDMPDGSTATFRYAANVATYVAARRWDRACLAEPLVQAQAAELDADSLAFLRRILQEVLATTGWPTPHQYRFEGDGVRVMLWSDSGQCDWWVSATDVTRLERIVRQLLDYSDLLTSFWSSDDAGTAMLQAIREGSPSSGL